MAFVLSFVATRLSERGSVTYKDIYLYQIGSDDCVRPANSNQVEMAIANKTRDIYGKGRTLLARGFWLG